VSLESELSWAVDGIRMYGTLSRPDGDGPFPAVVLVAGSGPTDRDWNSPLLSGANGSGRLLAQALATAGFVCLRYDKRASGPHVMENLPAMLGHISMQSHLDELTAAVTELAGFEFVDPQRIVGLGNSEGCLHVLHYATGTPELPLAAVVLSSPPGRTVSDLLLSQLKVQLAQLPDGDALFPLVVEAAARYSSGQPMDPDPQLPENIRMILSSFETPANLPFARELWNEDATDCLPKVRVPALVVIGEHDLQVDARTDGPQLEAAAQGLADVTFAYPPAANHVLKHEERSPAEVAASGDLRYSEADTDLDPEAVETILSWLVDRAWPNGPQPSR
jgi:dienelactone hydrolase